MRAYKKLIPAAAVLVLLGTFYSNAEPEWESGNWYYRKESGSRAGNELIKIDGDLYYFGNDGALVCNRAVEADGAGYYCSESGRCLKGQWKKTDGFENGEPCWRYYMENGKAFEEGWLQIGTDRYHFTQGRMDTGWYTEENENGQQNVYFLGTEEDGKMTKGWLAWKGGNVSGADEHLTGWYYFSENGRMISDTEYVIGNETYAFNGNGTMAVGFVRICTESGREKECYYDRRTGCRAEGWLYLSEESEKKEGWYYFSGGQALMPSNGTRKITEEFGVSMIDGNWYGFDGQGTMITGLVLAGENRYFCFDGNGKMATGYVAVPQDGITAPGEKMMFREDGTAPPALGASVDGILNGFLYKCGVKTVAEADSYEQIELETGGKRQSYVVSRNGTAIRSGIVTMDNGQKKKIIKQEDGWKLVPLLD